MGGTARSNQEEFSGMLNHDLLTPFANAKREQFIREAEEWRLNRSLEARPASRTTVRRRFGAILVKAGGHIGDISLDDCLPRRQQTV
jgi:hypothetical protein